MQANESPVSPPCLCLRILLSADRAVDETPLARMLLRLGHSVTKAAEHRDAHAEILEFTALKLAEDLSYLGALALARTARDLALVAKRRDFLKAGKLVAGLQSQLSEVTAVMSGASL